MIDRRLDPGHRLLRSILIVAFHFPPIQGSSGVQRTLAFAKYLRRDGWDVRVLTVHPFAYPKTDQSNNSLVPDDLSVLRCWSFDARRHFSVLGRYPDFLAKPDRWQSWIAFAVIRGLLTIRRSRPDVIMSTYPIASAHVIARTLHRSSGVPWVADLRDPIVFPTFPPEGRTRDSLLRLERSVVTRASNVIVTTPGAQRLYLERYGELASDKLRVIENGVDEESFAALAKRASTDSQQVRKTSVIHSGVVYPRERDPTVLFFALAELKKQGRIDADNFELVFRACGHEEFIRTQIAEAGVDDLVCIRPPISYKEALSEMAAADSVLLLQGSNCNDQIPAKAYEYLYLRKPVLALTDPAGDTAGLLRKHGITAVARLDDLEETVDLLRRFLARCPAGACEFTPKTDPAELSRRARTEELARSLDEVVSRG